MGLHVFAARPRVEITAHVFDSYAPTSARSRARVVVVLLLDISPFWTSKASRT